MNSLNKDDAKYDQKSLRDYVFSKLRDGILSGRYKPGESLVELKVSEELGVSRTPIREAIRKLELEGLVQVIPNKGAFVSGITDKDINDIYEIRMTIEGLAAKWAAIYATEAELADMEEVLALEEFYTVRRNYSNILALDSKFHQLVFKACKSKPLIHVLSTFHEYVRKARNRSLMSPGRALKAYEEHKAIFSAIKARDSELAYRIMTEHILKARESINRGNSENRN